MFNRDSKLSVLGTRDKYIPWNHATAKARWCNTVHSVLNGSHKRQLLVSYISGCIVASYCCTVSLLNLVEEITDEEPDVYVKCARYKITDTHISHISHCWLKKIFIHVLCICLFSSPHESNLLTHF